MSKSISKLSVYLLIWIGVFINLSCHEAKSLKCSLSNLTSNRAAVVVILNFSLCGWQAWAVASGKISEFPSDKARWKTNFRCALNNLSVRFKMIQDNSRNSDDPHKIYEIINTECEWHVNPNLSPCGQFQCKSRWVSFLYIGRQQWKSANPTLPGGRWHDAGHLQLSHRVLPLRARSEYCLERALTSPCWELLSDVCFNFSVF